MHGTYRKSLFSYYDYPNGQLGCVLNFPTQSIRAGMDPPVDSHTSWTPFLSGEYSLVVVDIGHPLGVATVTAAL